MKLEQFQRQPNAFSVTSDLNRRHFIGLGVAAMGATVLPSVAMADAPLNIVATTGMIADAVARIGGDQVSVKGLMGSGVDPHAYRQTRTDIVAMARADLVFWHGLYLEAQMEGFFHDLARRREVVAVAETLPAEFLLAHDVYADKVDPHIWMDPTLWDMILPGIADALTKARPQAGDVFAANLAGYQAEVRAIAGYAKTTLASVPPEARVLVTAHDAFKYFGAAHGFDVLGIQGISTESEAGLNRISELADFLVERKIGAVFVESSVSDRNIRALIEGAAAQGHEVKIGGELFSDAMGIAGTYEGTFIGMIDHNITTIAQALGGNAPLRGLNGLLGAEG